MTLTSSGEVSREGKEQRKALELEKERGVGRGKGRLASDIASAFQDFPDPSATLKYGCSLCSAEERNHFNEKLAALAGQAHSYINVV